MYVNRSAIFFILNQATQPSPENYERNRKKIMKHKNQTHKQTSIYKQHKGVKKKKFYFAAEAAEHYGSFMEHMEQLS